MPNGQAILSLHDVSPATMGDVSKILSTLHEWKIEAPSLLVIPNHHGRYPLEKSPACSSLIRAAAANGSEIVLHGFEHQSQPTGRIKKRPLDRAKAALLTAGEGEFLNLDYGQALLKLIRGKRIVEKSLGKSVVGFVAPAWLESRETGAAVRNAGLAFHEDHLFITDIKHQQRFFCPAISFSARSLARTSASIVWARFVTRLIGGPQPIRLALHPQDFHSTHLKKEILALIRQIARNRKFVSYSTFFAHRIQGE